MLFRPEVARARNNAWLGTISLAHPPAWWLAAAMFTLAAIVCVLFLAVATYTHRSTVRGHLVPERGLATVVAPANGVLARIHVEEGDRIAQGRPLAVLDIPRTTRTGEDVHVVLRQDLQSRTTSLLAHRRTVALQAEAESEGLARQLAAARSELAGILQEIETKRRQVELNETIVERYRRVLETRYVSEVQLTQQVQIGLDLLHQQQSLERQSAIARRTMAALEQSVRLLPHRTRAHLAAADRELAALDQERIERDAAGGSAVNAPLGGTVANRLVVPGQAVSAGQPMFVLLPGDAKLHAQLRVPSRAMGFIRPGDRVLLRYHAYPHEKFGRYGGRVVRISRSTIADAAAGSEPNYRVIVSLDRQSAIAFGRIEPLKAGMTFDADILGERRTLLEWVLAPIRSAPSSHP